MPDKLKILVVDDSVVLRRLLAEALAADAVLDVVTAASGRAALAKLDQVKPDLVTLDIEMPDLDGLATLRLLRQTHPRLPVIMFSSLTARGAAATLDALAAGANDYVAKPTGSTGVDETVARIRQELIPRIKALCGRRRAAVTATPPRPASVVASPALRPTPGGASVDVVAIGISTGGPNALSAMLPLLPADLPVPVVIVQHMPPVFTKLLAERLAAQCKIPVVEATAGLPLKPGHAVLAPGGSHLIVERRGTQVLCGLNEDAAENSCRPAVDVLFRSVAAVYGPRALAVVMTGMGSDGLLGCEVLHKCGAPIIVQDEASCVVWGMPGFVARAGLALKQLPLERIAAEIVQRTSVGRRYAA